MRWNYDTFSGALSLGVPIREYTYSGIALHRILLSRFDLADMAQEGVNWTSSTVWTC